MASFESAFSALGVAAPFSKTAGLTPDDLRVMSAESPRTRETETQVVVPESRNDGMAVRRPSVPRRVEPATAAKHAVRASRRPRRIVYGDFA